MTSSAVPSATFSPRYIASTRSTRAATLFTLWSTSSTAWPSLRKLAISSEKSATSPEVRPANGSSTSTTLGLRAIALASSSRRRSANGRVRGRRCITRASPTLRGDLLRSAGDAVIGGQHQQIVGQQGELDVFQDGLPVQRTRVLEDDADALAGDAVGGPAGDVGAG